MAAIRNNAWYPITLNFIGENGKPEKLFFLPGINLNIDNTVWESAKSHPVVKAYLDAKTLEHLLRVPRVEGELEDLPVVTSKRTDEPMLVTDGGKPATTRKAKA